MHLKCGRRLVVKPYGSRGRVCCDTVWYTK